MKAPVMGSLHLGFLMDMEETTHQLNVLDIFMKPLLREIANCSPNSRVATVELDKRICQDSTAGTTAVSLFLFPCPDVENGQPISVAMSIDHSPSLERESVRIQCRQELIWTGIPIEISKSPSNCIPSKPLSRSPTFDLSEHSDMRIYGGNDLEKDDNSKEDNIVHEIDYSPKPVARRLSFIDRRNGKGAKGPLVVFNGCGGSLMMTRSIGDRYGPRCCVAVPDISATTIPAHQHARFVLASDGMWDVIDQLTAQKVVLSIKNPQKAALKLAQMAFHRRMNHGMRFDDITVMVVDVNPKSFTPVTGTGCQCTMS
eukprot:gene38165-50048_t